MPSSFAIGDHFERFIRRQVDGGRYASASEVVRDALRLLELQEEQRQALLEALRSEIGLGLQSGAGSTAEDVLDRLESKYASMAQERGGS